MRAVASPFGRAALAVLLQLERTAQLLFRLTASRRKAWKPSSPCSAACRGWCGASLREWRKGGRIVRWLRENRAAAVVCLGYADAGRLRVHPEPTDGRALAGFWNVA